MAAAAVSFAAGSSACKDDDDILGGGDLLRFGASLSALNDTIALLDPRTDPVSGDAEFEIDLESDSLRALVEADGLAPDVAHRQHVHADEACPPASADENDDGFVDVLEGRPFYGDILIPLDGDLNSVAAGSSDFPIADDAGRIDYEELADLEALLNDLASELDDDDDLELGTRTVVLHGVDSTRVTLPSTVATLPGLSRYVTLPVACGVIGPT